MFSNNKKLTLIFHSLFFEKKLTSSNKIIANICINVSKPSLLVIVLRKKTVILTLFKLRYLPFHKSLKLNLIF